MPEDTEYSGYEPGAVDRIIALHMDYYGPNWHFGPAFREYLKDGLGEFTARLNPDRDLFLVAKRQGEIVGSVCIDGSGSESAQLRWFILDPAIHGKGIGNGLLSRAMDFVRQAGHRHVYLYTFAGLDAACRLYEKHGFHLTETLAQDNTYGTPVTGLRYDWRSDGQFDRQSANF